MSMLGSKRIGKGVESLESHASEPATQSSNQKNGAGEAATVSMLVERVEAEREQLFKAIAIVELCRLSTATLLETNDSECMIPALETTCDLLNASAERLEWISSDLQKLSRSTLPLTKEKRAELDRRLDAYEADRKPGRAAADVISSIRKRL